MVWHPLCQCPAILAIKNCEILQGHQVHDGDLPARPIFVLLHQIHQPFLLVCPFQSVNQIHLRGYQLLRRWHYLVFPWAGRLPKKTPVIWDWSHARHRRKCFQLYCQCYQLFAAGDKCVRQDGGWFGQNPLGLTENYARSVQEGEIREIPDCAIPRRPCWGRAQSEPMDEKSSLKAQDCLRRGSQAPQWIFEPI